MLQKRLLSLDLLRGLIMVLLALEAAGLYHILNDAAEGSWWHHITIQFRHHKWNGLRFWDLIQPGFMFIAGTAMAYSLNKQLQNGVPWAQSFRKALKRSGWLFFWGVLNYAVKKDGLSFELWNVLTQLSFTLLVAEVLYRFTNVPGFDQPFTDQHNFGNYVDLLLMNKINGGGWVAINCIPTAVHTIAGALAGKLMLSASTQKVKQLLIWGAVVWQLALGWTGCI